MRIALLAGLLLIAPVATQEETQEPQPAVVDVNAVRQAAFTAQQRGDAKAAADAFLELSSLEPTEPDWVVRAADNLGKSGQFNDAMDLLAAARERFPDVLSLRAMLARTYHLKADTMRAAGVRDANVVFYYQDAARTAEALLAIDPDHLDARLIVASASYQLGEYDDALAHAEKAVELHPREYGGLAMVGRICFQRFVEGKQQLSGEEVGDDAREAIATATEQAGVRARAAFEAAAKADPDRAFPRSKLGDLAAWSGDMDRALEEYARALAIDPNTTLDHGWLRTAVDADRRLAFYSGARAAYRARDGATEQGAATLAWYQAQALFDQASNVAPDVAPAERTAAWKAAGDLFEQTLEALPDYLDTYWWIVQTRYWGGDLAAAAKYAIEFSQRSPRRFADMIRRDDQTIAALIGMAADAYGKGRLADSRDLNQVIAYARQTADGWNNYAFLCRETRQFANSLAAYEEALRIEPGSPQLMNDAGVILQYHTPGGDSKQRARRYYETAIRIADEQLAAGELQGEALARVRTARRDARANLARMR